jgi:hypothetical protein
MTVEEIIDVIWKCGFDIFHGKNGEYVVRRIRQDAKMNNIMKDAIKFRRDEIIAYVRQVEDEIDAKWHRKPEDPKPKKVDW